MQAIIGLISLALAAYGFTQDGVLGILTGAIAGFGVGSGLAALAFTRKADAPFERTAQRIGGLISAIACAAGVYYGGWTLGSVLGMAGYLTGMLSTELFEIVLRRAQRSA